MSSYRDLDDPPARLATEAAIRRLALILSVVVFLALSFPPILFAATLSSLLAIAAGCVATVGLLKRDGLWADYLTSWDIAAALYAFSLFAGFFVDLEAIQVFLRYYDVQHT